MGFSQFECVSDAATKKTHGDTFLRFRKEYLNAVTVKSVVKRSQLIRFVSVFLEYFMEGVKRRLGVEVPEERLDTLEWKIVNSLLEGPDGTVIVRNGQVEFSCVKPNTAI